MWFNPRVFRYLRAGSQVTWGQSQPFQAWKLRLITLHKVPSPKSQVWHGCLHGNNIFLEVRVGTSVESWVKQEIRPNSQHKFRNVCAYINHDPTLMDIKPYFGDSSRIRKSRLCLCVGTCWHEWNLELETPCEPALSYSISQEVCWVPYVVRLEGSLIFKFSTS